MEGEEQWKKEEKEAKVDAELVEVRRKVLKPEQEEGKESQEVEEGRRGEQGCGARKEPEHERRRREEGWRRGGKQEGWKSQVEER